MANQWILITGDPDAFNIESDSVEVDNINDEMDIEVHICLNLLTTYRCSNMDSKMYTISYGWWLPLSHSIFDIFLVIM